MNKNNFSAYNLYFIAYNLFYLVRNNSPIFASNSFHQAKVFVNLGIFLVPCHSLERLLRLFYVFCSTYLNYPLYRSFHIFVHVRCNIRRCEKKDVEKKRSPQ